MSSSHPTSSPLRSTSRKVKSDHHTPPASVQSDLQKQLSKEIHDHAWEFDAKRIARMLSTAGKGPSEIVVNSSHNALAKKGKPCWPTVGSERPWYTPLAVFLNNCVDVCHGALDSHGSTKRDHRWYNRLKFIVYDRPTEDGVDGASAVRPDLVGGLDLVLGERVAWSPQDSLTKQALLPVEVKENWALMVAQAATYARCLFSDSPSRQFALVLGFRHTTAELRFLVFHRSGLTASKSFSVASKEGQKDILRVFLSILRWASPNDAGFLEFCDDFDMSLLRHKDDKTGVVASVAEVLHDGLCVQGRASRVVLMNYPTGEGKKSAPCIPVLDPTVRTRKHTEAEVQAKEGDDEAQPHVTPARRRPHRIPVKCPSPSTLVWSSALDTDSTNGDHAFVVVKHSWCEDKRQPVEADLLAKCKDGFGTPDHHYSFCPTDAHGKPMSTARFLPTDDEQLRDFHWKITTASKVPSHPQRRRLWIHVSKLVGRSLVHAKTPWELCVAIGHGMLGWLSMLRKGFLHRDVSIGNVLMLDPPVTMKPFEARPVEQLMAQLSLNDANELSKYASLLEEVIGKMGFSDKCHGFVIDGDMAASLEGYFTSRDTGERSGTYEFMSRRLVRTLWNPSPYLHSPVDDLESFYYTAQWAAAFNDGANGGKYDGSEIQKFREMIAGDMRNEAYLMVLEELYPDEGGQAEAYGPFFAHSLAFLNPWLVKVNALGREWASVLKKAGEFKDEEKEKYLDFHFLVYGYRGVGEYFELIHKNRALLQGVV